jgi:lipoic acid synthetase
VAKGSLPEAVDAAEPRRVADCVKRLGLKYVVVTSVTRDDLDDGGAGQFVNIVDEIRRAQEGVRIELLIPDLAGKRGPIARVALSGADIVGHNVETTKRLYPYVRRGADYLRSLDVLSSIKEANPHILTKSAILAGLGETRAELIGTMRDLALAGCDMLAIGQYLSPSKDHYPVQRFVTPEEFDNLRIIGEEIGFKSVSSGPFVRSSYLAEQGYEKIRNKFQIQNSKHCFEN